jgi:hypothetical protein
MTEEFLSLTGCFECPEKLHFEKNVFELSLIAMKGACNQAIKQLTQPISDLMFTANEDSFVFGIEINSQSLKWAVNFCKEILNIHLMWLITIGDSFTTSMPRWAF